MSASANKTRNRAAEIKKRFGALQFSPHKKTGYISQHPSNIAPKGDHRQSKKRQRIKKQI